MVAFQTTESCADVPIVIRGDILSSLGVHHRHTNVLVRESQASQAFTRVASIGDSERIRSCACVLTSSHSENWFVGSSGFSVADSTSFNMQAQEDQPNLGSVLHCALLLLGYKSSSYEVEADATMFDRSNTKGMEALLHFLLSRLRGSLQAKKARSNRNKLTVLQTTSALLEGCTSILQDFKGLWPIKDTRQQRDYRKVIGNESQSELC